MQRELNMHFTNFSVSELKEINQKTMERMRAQKIQTPAASTSADVMDDIFAHSKHAKFSRSDIRNALIAAMKKLREQQ
jgi:hypothetical protein